MKTLIVVLLLVLSVLTYRSLNKAEEPDDKTFKPIDFTLFSKTENPMYASIEGMQEDINGKKSEIIAFNLKDNDGCIEITVKDRQKFNLKVLDKEGLKYEYGN